MLSEGPGRRSLYEEPRLGAGEPNQVRQGRPAADTVAGNVAPLLTATGPSVVLLDFGGVIWNMRWDVAHTLEATNWLPQGSLTATLYGCSTWQEVERGRGDRDAWLAGAHAELERMAERPLPPLHAEWRASQRPIPETIELVRALRPPYRVGVLSNADLTLRTRLNDVLGI